MQDRGLDVGEAVRSGRAFLLPPELGAEQVQVLTASLLADPVTEVARIVAPGEAPADGDRVLVVRRHAGVADPEGQSARRAMRLLDLPVSESAPVESYRVFRVSAKVDRQSLLDTGGRAVANPTVEDVQLGDEVLLPHAVPSDRPCPRRDVPLAGLGDETLAELSRAMGLALAVEEMRALQAHYAAEGRAPSDVELETFAQTWSEHCKHKTLTGPVHFVQRDASGAVLRERDFGNLLKDTVFAATERLSPDWCWSVFTDNAGVVALTDEIGIAIKVETHNHPSALEPYGGAGTGIGGVIRDILGTGLGARPFANLDVFCVGPADLPLTELPPGTLHPDRVLEGVIAGVRDYGNRMGIPTVAGTVYRHPGYVANPLVFAGSVGEIPRDCVSKQVQPGDAIVAIGGRTGRDGIHGATFSSEALHEESESVDATAVQIGDPITEKKVLDAQLAARDRRLYRGITDCGAGGFSSAVGEMGEHCGAEIELSLAPLKYPGLTYSEIWISEAQERMVLAVPPEKLDELLGVCADHEVEAVRIGTFRDNGRLVLRWHGEVVGDMPMDFLHEGVPQPIRQAEYRALALGPTPWPAEFDRGGLLLRTLSHPAVASKEAVVRQYDFEVQGGTISGPCQGVDGRGPGDGAVIKPRLDLPQGVALGCGLAPRIGELDPYAGAACAIDEAIRNVVAAGGNPHRTAILDNFCWGDCRKPDRLGSLARAAEACYDAALAYGAPFVSGKDSLNNEYRVGGEERPIPPTLLCTAIAPLEDAEKATSTPLKQPGNLLAVVGGTGTAGGGSVASDLLGLSDSLPPVPDFETAPAVLDALHKAILADLVRACHDLSEGGLAVAAAEMVIGSRHGARIDSTRLPRDRSGAALGAAAAWFAETPTRFLVEIEAAHAEDFLRLFRTLPCALVGEVTASPSLTLVEDGTERASVPAAALAAAHRGDPTEGAA